MPPIPQNYSRKLEGFSAKHQGTIFLTYGVRYDKPAFVTEIIWIPVPVLEIL